MVFLLLFIQHYSLWLPLILVHSRCHLFVYICVHVCICLFVLLMHHKSVKLKGVCARALVGAAPECERFLFNEFMIYLLAFVFTISFLKFGFGFLSIECKYKHQYSEVRKRERESEHHFRCSMPISIQIFPSLKIGKCVFFCLI